MLNKLALASVCFVIAQGALATPMNVQTVISEIDVATANGGINPDGFAYKIDASLLVGGNTCEAKGVTVSLTQKVTDGVLNVVPMKRVPRGEPQSCPRIWAPVYRTISITVRGLSTKVSDVVIHNIEQYGTTTSVAELLDESRELSLTGTLTQVMAIGGESTGYAIVLPTGESVELDLVTNNLDRGALELDGATITVRGVYKTVTGIEIPSRRVLEVTSLEGQL